MRIAPFLAAALLALPATLRADDADALWPLLTQIRITETETETSWSAHKHFPPELEALDAPVSITGYPVIVLSEAEVTTFMLVRDRDDCPFCGSGAGYGPSLEVELANPVSLLEPGHPHVVTGTLELIRDETTWQAYRMVDARIRPL
jgi:hypothetical protein